MQTRRLGSQGPEISVIGFGAWEAGLGPEWGEAPPTEQVVAAMRQALDDGIDWIDTAEVYGDGRSEEVVAEAIRGRRDEMLIATKLAPAPEGTGFRPDEVARGCRQSLERLETDRIDLYQLHWPDDTGVPIEETWGAMAGLVDEGLVRYIGVSNFDRPLIERCEAIRHVDSASQGADTGRRREAHSPRQPRATGASSRNLAEARLGGRSPAGRGARARARAPHASA